MSEREPWWIDWRSPGRGKRAIALVGLGVGLTVTVAAVWLTPVGESIAVAAGTGAGQFSDRVAGLPLLHELAAGGRIVNGLPGTGGGHRAPAARASTSVAEARSGARSPRLEDAPVLVPARTRSTVTPAPVAPTPPVAPSPTAAGPSPAVPSSTLVPAATIAPVLAPSVQSLLNPTNRYFGLYTREAPFSWKDFDAVSDQLGYQSQIVGYFQGWDRPFRADAVASAWRHGQLPLMTWEPEPSDTPNNVTTLPGYSLKDIIDGRFDVYLRAYADAITTSRLPVAIRLAHEMNSTWYPWTEDDGHGNSINGNAPGDYVQMWRHVHDVFQAEGADRYVLWVWSPNIINNLTRSHRQESYLRSLYPGDDYVDLVGLSGYLRPDYKPDNTFSFDYTFGASLQQLRSIAPSKKILLSEVGSSDIGGHKSAWEQSMFSALQSPANDDVIGLVWFDRVISTVLEGAPITNDFRIEADPASIAAVRAGLSAGAAGFGALPTR